MPYRPLLDRIRTLFSEPSLDAHYSSIAAGFRTGRLRAPIQPMTDQELARAIREFQATPVSDWTLGNLAAHFDKT